MKKLSDAVRSDLEAGVSLTRLAELSQVAASTLRNYEKEGLIVAIPGQTNDEQAKNQSKKLYNLKALESALEVKRLRDSGLSLKEIAASRLGVEASEPVSQPKPQSKLGRAVVGVINCCGKGAASITGGCANASQSAASAA